jgi:alanine racemase
MLVLRAMTRPVPERLPPTWAEVDLDAVRANLGLVRGLVPRGTKVLLTVKADAYGLGATVLAREALGAGVEMLGVATLHEAMELRLAGIAAPVLILSPSLEEEADDIVGHDLRATVGTIEMARALSSAAARTARIAVVHVEVDTGMGRAGVPLAAAPAFLDAVARLSGLALEGIYTHFPVSNENDVEFTRAQAERFAALVASTRAAGLAVPLAHAANSAALLNAPFAHFDMVRPGLLAYGFNPLASRAAPIPLSPAMSLKSRVLQVRDIATGDSISYGRTFVARRPSRIAVVGIGYGHGYSRLLSNRGSVLVGGARAPIVGRVTMDMTMADVTSIHSVAPGAEVVLFGRQGGAEISVDEVAALQHTVSYEVTSVIGRRVARLYLRGGAKAWLRTMVGEGAAGPPPVAADGATPPR